MNPDDKQQIGIVIPGFPNYSITRDGQVWVFPRKDKQGRLSGGRYRKLVKYKGGYYAVKLHKKGEMYFRRVHRLVLETYIGPHPRGMECRHLNGNPADNRLENLAWGTPKENMQDRTSHGNTALGELNGRAKLAEQDVRMIIYMYRTGLFTQREIAKLYNITQTTISSILRKKIWKHIWNN